MWRNIIQWASEKDLCFACGEADSPMNVGGKTDSWVIIFYILVLEWIYMIGEVISLQLKLQRHDSLEL